MSVDALISLVPLLKAFSLTSITLSGKVTARVSALLYTFFRLPPLKVSSQIKGLPFPPPMPAIVRSLIFSGIVIVVGHLILFVFDVCSIFTIRKSLILSFDVVSY